MCRCTKLSSPFPKALLGKGMHTYLEKSLNNRATYYSDFIADAKIDSYVKQDKKTGALIAAKKSADFENKDPEPEPEKFPLSTLHWKFPYWKALNNLKPLHTKTSKGKYDRFDGGPFVYPSKAPKPINRTKARVQNDRSTA